MIGLASLGGPHLLAAQFWIFDPIYSAMGTVLAWLYAVVPSYGLAIALLTVAVRILLIPLTTKQVKSQQAMQRIQPELKRLQAKYKDDRQKLNEEMMKFYKENKVNPVSGCLPLLLQTPLFLVLYRLILGLTHRPEPKHLPRTSEMFHKLVESGGTMKSWGIDLAKAASSQHGLGKAWPYYILVAITVVTGFYQQRQMTARMPAGQVNPQMQMMGRIFPAVIGLISLNIPAGVVVYFIVSNIWQIGQQEITFRTLGPVQGGPPASTSKGDKGDKESGGASKDGAGRRRGGKGSARTPPKGAKPQNSQGAKGSNNKAQRGNSGAKPPAKGQAKGQPNPPQKGKRPPPSPRPKGLPGPGANGQQNPSTKNTPPRKDT